MKVEGHVFVVTGGASGLGEATIRAVCNKGGKGVIFDIPKQAERANAIVQELGADNCVFIPCDVTNEDSIVKAIEAAGSKWGKIHGNINCAGVGSAMTTVQRDGTAHNMQYFEFVVRVNLIGTFSVASKCASWMAKNEDEDDDGEHGVIINVASVAAFDGQNGQVSYSAAKAGIAGMTLPMARDLSRHGVRVNTIAPGTFGTPMTVGLEQGKGKKVGDGLKSAQLFPSKRFGKPEEFAALAIQMIENKMLNGDTVRLDGGIRMPRL